MITAPIQNTGVTRSRRQASARIDPPPASTSAGSTTAVAADAARASIRSFFFVIPTMCSPGPDPWVDQRVGQVHHEIDQCVGGGRTQHQDLKDGEIPELKSDRG